MAKKMQPKYKHESHRCAGCGETITSWGYWLSDGPVRFVTDVDWVNLWRKDSAGLRRRPFLARVHFCRECGAKRVGHRNPRGGVGPSGIVYGVYNPFRQALPNSACLRLPYVEPKPQKSRKLPL